MASEAGTPGERLERSREWPTDTLPVGELIRHRAYGLWLLRDGLNGSDVEDWLNAEEEVLDEIKNGSSENFVG